MSNKALDHKIKISNGVAFFESYPLPKTREVQWRGTLAEMKDRLYNEKGFSVDLQEHLAHHCHTHQIYM